MKNLFCSVFILLFSAYLFASTEFVLDEDGFPSLEQFGDNIEGFDVENSSCTEEACNICVFVSEDPNESEKQPLELSCASQSQKTSLGGLQEAIGDLFGEGLPICTENSKVNEGTKEMRQKRRAAKKSCKKAFRLARKRMAKEAFKNKRFLGALKLRLQRFGKTGDFRARTRTINLKDLGIDISSGGASREQIEEAILESLLENPQYKKLMKRVEEVEEVAQGAVVDNKRLLHSRYSYKYDYNKKLAPPRLTMIDINRNCRLQSTIPELPKPKMGKPRVLPSIDFLKNFPNDCAFFTSNSFTEEDVAELLDYDINNKQSRKKYCAKSQKAIKEIAHKNSKDEDPMKLLDERVEQLIEAAEEGFIPKFTISSTRNLYDDYTKDLAKKRGIFIQKYLWKKLDDHFSKNSSDERAFWLENFESFSDHIEIKTPSYDENREPGDYGPSPYAKEKSYYREAIIGGERKKIYTPSQQEEVDKFQKYLKEELEKYKEKQEMINESIAKKEEEKKEYEEELKSLEEKINKFQEIYRPGKNIKFDQNTEANKFFQMKEDINQLNDDNEEYRRYVSRITLLNNQIHTLKGDLDFAKTKLEKISLNDVEVLKNYYKNKNQNFKRAKSQFGEFFEKFKKVDFEGGFLASSSEDYVTSMLANPKLKALLNAKLKTVDYQCSFNGEFIKTFKIEKRYSEFQIIRDKKNKYKKPKTKKQNPKKQKRKQERAQKRAQKRERLKCRFFGKGRSEKAKSNRARRKRVRATKRKEKRKRKKFKIGKRIDKYECKYGKTYGYGVSIDGEEDIGEKEVIDADCKKYNKAQLRKKEERAAKWERIKRKIWDFFNRNKWKGRYKF